LHLGRQVPQNGIGRRVYAQRGRDQVQQRCRFRQLDAREIAVLLKGVLAL